MEHATLTDVVAIGGSILNTAMIAVAAAISKRSHHKTRDIGEEQTVRIEAQATKIETQMQSVALDLQRIESHVVGPDGKNGMRKALADLRSDFEREANAQGMERKDTEAMRLNWSLWRQRVESRMRLINGRTKQLARVVHEDVMPEAEKIDRAVEDVRRDFEYLKRQLNAQQPDDVGKLERRSANR